MPPQKKTGDASKYHKNTRSGSSSHNSAPPCQPLFFLTRHQPSPSVPEFKNSVGPHCPGPLLESPCPNVSSYIPRLSLGVFLSECFWLLICMCPSLLYLEGRGTICETHETRAVPAPRKMGTSLPYCSVIPGQVFYICFLQNENNGTNLM